MPRLASPSSERRRPIPPHRLGCHHPGVFARRALTLWLGLLVTPALADPRFEGRFQGRGEGRLELQVLDLNGSGIAGTADGYLVDADTSLLDRCTGGMRGLAREVAPLTLRLRREAPEEDTCTLTLRFSPDYARVEMSEERCFAHHGTECAFAGILRRR